MNRTACAVLILIAWAAPLAAQTNNACDEPGEEPDVIVGGIIDIQRFGNVDGITAFAIGTESCNIGSCQADWIGGTPRHPVIGQNLFRLKDGRFEQIGQSWLKHSFATLDNQLCSNDCIPADGQHLGVNCSDPYGSFLNGSQAGLGPKFEVNATTGTHLHPYTGQGVPGNAIYKRLQVHDEDLDPAQNPGAQYWVEGQYVTLDDAQAGNNANNNSYHEVVVQQNGSVFDLALVGQTVRELPAIYAWQAADPSVVITEIDGLLAAVKVTFVDFGRWRYEYAIQNITSHDSVSSFRLPVPQNGNVTAIGFHDVDYHSGEPYEGTDWEVVVEQGDLIWRSESFEDNPDANALRWGTLYNFRFEVNLPPVDGRATIGKFRPASPNSISWQTLVPELCGDEFCQAHEDCVDCPQDCQLPTSCCGDDVCDVDETRCNCPGDCGAPLTGEAVCDDGVDDDCDGLFDCDDADCCASGICPVGLGLCCNVPDDCDTSQFCVGNQSCIAKICVPFDPCPDELCDENLDQCVDCLDDSHCSDGLFCNGLELCSVGLCEPAADPCSVGMCDEELDLCVECFTDQECDDGIFCNGAEACVTGFCGSADAACPGQPCDEQGASCVGSVALQPRMGQPLAGLNASDFQRFTAGRVAFDQVLQEQAGLGPIFNQNSCGSCHNVPLGGSGTQTVTRFGFNDDKGGGFDPLAALGGSLLQAEAISPECQEIVPPEHNVTALRLTNSVLGFGLVESVSDGALWLLENSPPDPQVSGRVHYTEDSVDDPGVQRAGRFGWKSQVATLLTFSADASLNEMGLTNRFFTEENAPNGDTDLLALCDTIPDPEDGPDPSGLHFIDRVTDFQRFLAPPPQTPRSGMSGEAVFNGIGCASCHVASFRTIPWNGLPEALRDKPLSPYSDFLLHDMGLAADFIVQGDAQARELRTPPLWGVRVRDPLWHDGRVAGGTFDDRIRAAIAEHDSLFSEAAPSAQAFAAATAEDQTALVAFLDSLGRAEFDQDGDGNVDGNDEAALLVCAGGGPYAPDDPCAISDVDQDGDVDGSDYALFLIASDGLVGSVPDGSSIGGNPLTLALEANGDLSFAWGASCIASDDDYAIYEGDIGDFGSHEPLVCSTGGATSGTLPASSGNTYYLVVPNNGEVEGSYGRDERGLPRVTSMAACFPRSFGGCQ